MVKEMIENFNKSNLVKSQQEAGVSVCPVQPVIDMVGSVARVRKSFLMGLLGLSLMIAGSGGCASAPQSLLASHAVPAAQGTIKTELTNNGNTRFVLTVKHLAAPSNVREGAATYVVWITPKMGQTSQNVGSLKVNEDLTGTLQSSVPFKAFRLFVTAEATTGLVQPTGAEVLWINVGEQG